MMMGDETKRIVARWAGDSDILRVGATVTVLAADPEGNDASGGVPARTACWVRHWPEGRDFPQYRSCDLADLDLSDEDIDRLRGEHLKDKPEWDRPGFWRGGEYLGQDYIFGSFGGTWPPDAAIVGAIFDQQGGRWMTQEEFDESRLGDRPKEGELG
jgi:hypothetical protein